MDAHQHTPNPYDNLAMTRRDAAHAVLGLAALVVGATLFDKARSHITRMTPAQRDYLKEVLATGVTWIDIPGTMHGESRWMAKHADGSSVTVSVRKTHKGEVRGIEVSDSPKPFTYRCPEYRHSVHDQPVVDQVLASVRTSPK
jgi:hypothetical protein